MPTRVAAAIVSIIAAMATYSSWSATAVETETSGSRVRIVAHPAPGDALAPGRTAPVSFTGDNEGSTSVLVRRVTGVVTVDAAHERAGCLASDFSIAPLASNTTIPPGAVGFPLGASAIAFANTTRNQNGCQGATITVTASFD